MSNNHTVESIQNVRERSFQQQYEAHDVLQDHLKKQLTTRGFDYKQYGVDDRTADEIYFSGRPDFAVSFGNRLVAYVEVKSKRLSSGDGEWFGRLNRRHWENYLHGSDEFAGAESLDVPVILYFGVIDEEKELVIRDGFIEVSHEDQVQNGFTVHGNVVLCLDEDDVRNFQWFTYRTLSP